MNGMHLHLAINHSPLYSTMFAFFFVVVGMILRNRAIVTAGLVIAVIAALCGIAAHLTGDQAEEAIEKSAPIAGVDKTLIKEHDEAAGWVVTSSCITAGLAIVVMIVGWRKGQRPRWMEVVVAVFLLWSLSVVARTALLGGRIHHPEVRAVVRG